MLKLAIFSTGFFDENSQIIVASRFKRESMKIPFQKTVTDCRKLKYVSTIVLL